MSDDRRDLGEALPQDSQAQQPFMKEFEQAIASYAQATEAGKAEEALGSAFQALALAAEEAQRHPTPSLMLKAEAAECESKRDWVGAEAAYRKVLAVEQAAGKHGLIAKAQMDLSRLVRLLGRLEEASEIAASATASARQAEIFPLLVMALENEISCALATQESKVALMAATESVQVIEPGRIYDSLRARGLTNQARCLVATGDLAEAESSLAASWDLLQAPGTCPSMPGPNSATANWWEVKGQVLERQGKIEDAREALTHSIDYRRQNDSPYAVVLLIRALERFAELSQRTGNLTQADRAAAEVKSLREDLRLPIPK
jgi:tetratricopeptide (TPR) repeat protein